MNKKRAVKIANTAGFCFGVRRAIDIAEKTSGVSKSPVYTMGPLIHNPQEVQRLSKQGVLPLNRVNGLKNATLILRTHGIPKKEMHSLKRKNLNIVDATCPFVKRAQDIVKKLRDDDYQVVIVGEKTHPEVVALVSYAGHNCAVVERKEDLKKIKIKNKIGVVSQTTQTPENFAQIIGLLKKKCPEAKIFNTICRATVDRQTEAKRLAKSVDTMIVVGGKISGNTRRLAQICKPYARTYLIETGAEIKPGWIRKAGKIGITAGASTPDWIIEIVRNNIRNIN